MSLSTIDFVSPISFTGANSFTGAQLDQAIGGLGPASGIGLLIWTTDIAVGNPPVYTPTVPNVSQVAKWQFYFWGRLQPQNNTATIYFWNPNGVADPTLLNWQPINSINIPPGSITGNQIAANTITATNIANVASSSITGAVPNIWLAALNNLQTGYVSNGLMNNNSLVFGDLAGAGSTVAIPVIAVGAITGQNGLNGSQGGVSGKLALQTITGANIQNNSLGTGQLVSTGAAASTSFTLGGVDPQNNITVPTLSVTGIPGTSTQTSAAGDVLALNSTRTGWVSCARAMLKLADPSSLTTLQVPVVLASTTTYAMSSLQGAIGAGGVNSVGRIIQQAVSTVNTTQSTTTTLAMTGTAPTTANTVLYTGFGAAGTITFTPLLTTSTITVELDIAVSNSNSNNPVAIVLFNGTTPVASKITVNGTTNSGSISLHYSFAPGSTSAISFGVYFVGTANTTYINEYQGVTTGIAATLASSYKITEYI